MDNNEIKHRGRKPKQPAPGLGANLRRLRTQRNINQTALAEAIGIQQGMIASMESGHKRPSLETLSRLAEYFGVGFDELMKVTPDESAAAVAA